MLVFRIFFTLIKEISIGVRKEIRVIFMAPLCLVAILPEQS